MPVYVAVEGPDACRFLVSETCLGRGLGDTYLDCWQCSERLCSRPGWLWPRRDVWESLGGWWVFRRRRRRWLRSAVLSGSCGRVNGPDGRRCRNCWLLLQLCLGSSLLERWRHSHRPLGSWPLFRRLKRCRARALSVPCRWCCWWWSWVHASVMQQRSILKNGSNLPILVVSNSRVHVEYDLASHRAEQG